MKTMIVTGASGGIGRALALRAAQANYSLVIVGRDAAALEEVERMIHNGGGRCTSLAIDVRDEAAPAAIVATAIQRYGAIDVLVNAAGFATGGALLQQSDAEIKAQFETHVLAPLRLTRQALPDLLRAQGQVFFFGSGVARVPTPGLGAYPSAKAAVRAMTTQLRRELRESGLAITYVDPGAVDTQFMHRASMAGPPQRLLISPHTVAKKILRAVELRSRTVNAAPLQTAIVALSELFPTLTDAVLAAFPELAGAAPTAAQVLSVETSPILEGGPQPPPPCHAEPVEAWPQKPAGLDAALEPVTRRMERVKLPRTFIEQLLVPGSELELGEVAMRWAGMPNKNERAAVSEVFEALTAADYLKKTGDETWTVLRSSTHS